MSNIKEGIKFLFRKIPAAAMIIPMLLSMVFNSLFPHFVQIGSLTTAVFAKGAVVPLTGIVLFCAGTQLKLNEAPAAVKRGAVLLGSKFAAGYLVGTLIATFFGAQGIFGINTIALFAAFLTSNGAIYLAISGEYGDQVDIGAYSVLSIKDGPFLTLLALGVSGANSIPLSQLFAAIFPMLFGILLGNVFNETRAYFKAGTKVCIPLIGIAVGASLNLGNMFTAGLSGVLLGIIAFAVGASVLLLADKLILRRPGYAGAALASVAGSSCAIPAIVAGIIPELQDMVGIASVQLAAAVIVTAILCPTLTSLVLKKWGAPNYHKEPEGTPAPQQ